MTLRPLFFAHCRQGALLALLMVGLFSCRGDSRTFKAHTGAVNGIAVSADGRQALSCGQDRFIRHWDLETGHLLREIGPLEEPEEGIAFADGGRWAVSVGDHHGRGLHLWDLKTGTLLRSMEEPVINGSFGPMRRLSVSADGMRALAPGRGETVALWDLASGALLLRCFGHWNNNIALGFGPGEATIVSAGEDGQAMVHTAETGKELRRIEFSHESGMIVDFSHGGTILPGGRQALVEAWSDGHRLALIDLEGGRILRKFEGHTEEVAAIVTDQRGRRAASAGWDGVRLWDLETGAELAHFQGQARTIAMNPDGSLVALGLQDGRIRLTAWPTQTRLSSIASEQALFTGAGIYDHGSLTFAPDGKTLWTASGSQLTAWSFPSGRLLRSFGFEQDPLAGKLLTQATPGGPLRLTMGPEPQLIHSLALAPDGQRLLTGETGPHRGLRLWDLQSGQPLQFYPGGSEDVRFSADGQEAYSSWLSSLLVTDLASGQNKRVWSATYPPGLGTQVASWLRTGRDAPSRAQRMAFSGDARWALVAFTRDHKVAFWDCAENREYRQLGKAKHTISALALSPNADLALTGDEAGRVTLRSTFARSHSLELQAHQGEVTAAAFAPDGRFAASGGEDGAVLLWDTHTLALACTFRGAIKAVTGLAFSPDGKWLTATGRFDPAIHVWRIPD